MTMELAFLIPVAAAIVAFSIASIVAERRAAAWREAARRVGLTGIREKKTLGMLQDLRGESDGFTVILQTYQRGKNNQGTRLIVSDAQERIPASLDLRAEDFSSAIAKTFGAKEVEVGDPGFDDAVYVRGPEDLLLALLDDPTRSLVRQVVGMDGRIVDGKLRAEWRGSPKVDKLVRSIETFLAMGRGLARPVDVTERLVAGLRGDPTIGVRVRCLDLLARKFRGDERARAAFRETLGPASPELRLRAAMALGEEGRATLIEIASCPEADETCIARAIAALGAHLPLDRAVAILDSALASGRRTTFFAAVGALGAIGGAAGVERLSRLVGDADGELAVAAARSLAASGDSAGEPALIAALTAQDATLRLAAADGLAHVGSTAAVAPLHAAVEGHLLDLDLRSAARHAIASIQSRITGASPGQMSLAEGEAGQVSLTEEERAGRVTMTEGE
jgi:hypothetical protein